MKRVFGFLSVAGLTLGVAACGQNAPPPEAPVVRPVLSVLAEPVVATSDSFVGTVVARDEIAYAFRLGGALTSRAVDIGETVSKGQLLATMEATSLQLAVSRAQADLASAQAQQANASASENRLKALQVQDNATQAQLDAAAQLRQAAEANVAQAQSGLDNAQQQLDEARLYAQADGVVISVDAETGQVVAPGASILRVARPDARDLAIDVPASFASSVKVGTMFNLALQLDPTIIVSGRLREIAPQANATTRARRLLIQILDSPASFWIGTTATASVVADDSDAAQGLVVPASAVFEVDGASNVWVVDEAGGTVTRRPVTTETPAGGPLLVRSGLTVGERVVTLGVDELTDGQQVRVETGL
jgi:RND family efflux transporter MFP subunit